MFSSGISFVLYAYIPDCKVFVALKAARFHGTISIILVYLFNSHIYGYYMSVNSFHSNVASYSVDKEDILVLLNKVMCHKPFNVNIFF